MSRTLQFRRLGTATLANTIGANGELIINSTNKALTVHDGSTPGGFALLNQATDNNIDQYARNTANTASNNINILIGVNTTQNTNIETAINLSQGAYDNSNTKFNADGGQISGDVVIVGNLDVTNNTAVTNTMEANNVIIDGTLYTGLAARSSVVLPHLVAQFASNSASYIQVNSQNINPQGSADYVITADNGTDSDFFVDLGLKGSQSYDQILTPYDGYLTVQGSTIGQSGGNLIIGTTSSFPGLETKFVAGGYANNNVVMKLGTYGANVVGNLDVTGTINVNNVLTILTSPPAASPSITVIATQNQDLRLRAVSNTWTFVANGSLRFPDNTSQTTAFTGSAIDQDARNSANAAAQTIPQNAQSTDYTLQLTDAGKHIYYTQASNTTLYIPTTSNVAFSNGSTIMIISATSAGANVTVSPNTGVTMYLAGNTTSVSRNVTTYGMATLIQVAANTWFINGTGVA
jgi:cytoskeletal protein CcmA (bactofilin family)